MPIRFFANQKGKLIEISTGLEKQTGWWNSITGFDKDNDGYTNVFLTGPAKFVFKGTIEI